MYAECSVVRFGQSARLLCSFRICEAIFCISGVGTFLAFGVLLQRLSENYDLTFWRQNYFFLILAHPVYKM